MPDPSLIEQTAKAMWDKWYAHEPWELEAEETRQEWLAGLAAALDAAESLIRSDERERTCEIIQGRLSEWQDVDGHDADAVCDELHSLLNLFVCNCVDPECTAGCPVHGGSALVAVRGERGEEQHQTRDGR